MFGNLQRGKVKDLLADPAVTFLPLNQYGSFELVQFFRLSMKLMEWLTNDDQVQTSVVCQGSAGSGKSAFCDSLKQCCNFKAIIDLDGFQDEDISKCSGLFKEEVEFNKMNANDLKRFGGKDGVVVKCKYKNNITI